MMELPNNGQNPRYAEDSFHAQLSYADCQKDMLRWFVEWLEQYNRSVWGGFSGDIPPVVYQELKDKLAELEG